MIFHTLYNFASALRFFFILWQNNWIFVCLASAAVDDDNDDFLCFHLLQLHKFSTYSFSLTMSSERAFEIIAHSAILKQRIHSAAVI